MNVVFLFNYLEQSPIQIFQRQIGIPEITRIKTYMDTLGVRNTSSEHFSSSP